MTATMPPRPRPLFVSTREVCDLVGLSYRVVDYWARTEVLTGAVRASGSGSRRRYTLRDVEVAKVLAQLARHGAETDLLREVAVDIRDIIRTEGMTGLLYFGRTGQVSRVPASGWVVDLDALV